MDVRRCRELQLGMFTCTGIVIAQLGYLTKLLLCLNLARQLDRSDSNLDILLIHLANLQQRAIFIKVLKLHRSL